MTAPDLSLVLAINAGGASTTYEGVNYIADRFASGGSANSTTDPISGVSEPVLFQTERYGSYAYEVPITEGTYSVELHFVEMYHEAAGERAFNVAIEGEIELPSVDLFSLVGHDGAYTYSVENIRVTDGSLSIELETIVDNATLSGLAIYSADGDFVEPPPPPPIETSAENPGSDCDVPSLPSAASLANTNGLPDPFTKLDGTRMTAKSEWRCRRAEILKQSYTYIYGDKPPRPDNVSGSVSSNRVSVNVSHGGNSTSFNVSVSLPSNGQPPYPAVIGYGGGFLGMSAQMRSTLTSQGIAVIEYDPYALGAENGGSSAGSGAFYDIYGGGHSAGLLMAWAWGISRIIDVLESDPTVIDPTKLGVTGCSRFGKGAFTAGAFDGRVALTIPIESGIGGLVSLKMVPTVDPRGEQPSHAINYQPWLSPSRFRPFANNTGTLPIDMHEIVGLVAPRGLLVLDNPNSGGYFELATKSSYGSAVAGKEIYKALGHESNITYIGSAGDHCGWRSDYTQPLMDAASKFLKGNDPASTGQFRTNSFGTPNMGSWINWTTPTLSGELQ